MIGLTYKEKVNEWVSKQDGTIVPAALAGAQSFAEWLDSSQLGLHLEVVALIEGRKVDRECMKALIEAIGEDKASDIVRPILAKFKRTHEVAKPVSE